MSGLSNAVMGMMSSATQSPGLTVQTPRSQAATAAATSATASSTSSSSTPTFSSSDFLTLLVSELKNQDPTQPTDPSTYVQQLVGVNSLEQLISINQELGSGSSSTTPTTTAAQGTSTGQ